MKNFVRALVPRAIKEKIRGMMKSASTATLDSLYAYPPEWVKRRHSYGQYGEDIKILPLFSGKTSGWFVEVGAMEGVRFSNTYLFELLGWKGICMEPHPDYFPLLKKNRPHSIAIHAAAGKEDKGAVDFHTNYRGFMSTLDGSLEGFFKSHYGTFFGGFKTIQVPLLTLNTALGMHHAPSPIDILSVDTEGTEADVLEGFDFERYAPRVVIAEISIRKEPVFASLARHGYKFACANPSNAIFCRSEEDVDVICRTNVVGEPLSPQHPLDTHI